MFRLAVRNALAGRARLLRTVLAIAIGVGFVTGTFVLADTTIEAFERAGAEQGGDFDFVVRSVAPFTGTGSIGDREPLPDTLIERIAAVEGVAGVDAGVVGYAQVVAPDGTAVTPAGPPTLGSSWGLDQPADELVAGRPPDGPDEVVLDERTFDHHGFVLGGDVEILFVGPARRFTIVGVHDTSRLLGATLAVFDLRTAQTVLDREGTVDQIAVAVAHGAEPAEVRAGLASLLTADQEVVTDEQSRREAVETWTDSLGFLRTVLLVFAAIALLVAAFLIFNTFSILLTQRTRELGLLRAIGAGRGQVTRSVLAEAFLVGTAASVVGIGLGVLGAIGAVAAIRGVGIDLPSTEPIVLARTVAVALVTGVVTSLVAAGLPAWRAGRLSPMAALAGAGDGGDGRVPARSRSLVGAAVVSVGVTVMAIGLWGEVDSPIRWVGPGAAALFVAAAVFGPLLVAPVARVTAPLLERVVGEPAVLGHQNAVRDARRTAATAAALMIGIGLVSFVVVVAESTRASALASIDESITADLLVMPDTSFVYGGFSPRIATELSELAEVGSSSSLRTGQFGLGGTAQSLVAVDPAEIGQLLRFGGTAADTFDALEPQTLAVADRVMQERGWSVGDAVELTFARTGTVAMPIVGTFGGTTTETDSGFVVSLATYDANFTDSLDAVVYLRLADGVDPVAGRAAVEAVLASYPNVRTVDMGELRQIAADQVDQILAMVGALLALSVVIAFVGIANTLALSITERTRELGLLRAVGMSRRQMKRMVRSEATIVAVLGVGAGVLAGFVLSWSVIRALADIGIDHFRVPWVRIAVVVVLAVLTAAIAAAGPARRAAHLPILDAISGP